MNQRGQSTIEMMFLVPLFAVLIGGGMSAIYIGWQSLKVQQAANVAARIQGQERVAGGRSIESIRESNGQDQSGDAVYANDSSIGALRRPQGNSVYTRLYEVVKDVVFKGQADQVRVPKPHVGQTVDTVTVIRYITLPKIPFLSREAGKENVKLQAFAYGGEDTHMYALPRWGKTGGAGLLSGSASAGQEWHRLVKESKTSSDE